VTDIPLVLLLGIISTIQTHLAKALERQGIEVFDQIKAKLQKSGQPVEGGLKKPVIYTIGVALNNTLFVWSTLAQPYGPPALFSSMFGIGLVFLMVYAGTVLKEKITRREMAGAAAILLGTLAIGLDNLIRAEMDRFRMNLTALFVALGLWLALSLAFVVLANRARRLGLIALAYGLLAGGLGSLDPFFKGVGQNYGGRPGFLPSNPLGSVLFISSFVIGFLAFLVTQFGFAKKARASLLVPAYNAAFIGLPILWQLLLLPGYRLSWLTAAGTALVLAGVAGMQVFKAGKGPALERSPQPGSS
jgi:drug/metabolite transporter (DMT)-like permease